MNEEKLNMPDDVVEAVRKLANENCALAAGQCIVPGGLQGDDGGVQFCNLERRLINQRAKNATLEYTLNQALAARDSARAKCDEAIGRNTRRENTNQFLLQVCEASAEALAKARQQIDNYAAELAGTRDLLHNASAQIAVKDAALGEKDKVIRALRSERDEARRERDQLYSDVHDMVGAIEERKAPQGGLSLAQARVLRRADRADDAGGRQRHCTHRGAGGGAADDQRDGRLDAGGRAVSASDEVESLKQQLAFAESIHKVAVRQRDTAWATLNDREARVDDLTSALENARREISIWSLRYQDLAAEMARRSGGTFTASDVLTAG